MKRYFCVTCIESAAQTDIRSLSVDDFNCLRDENSFAYADACPVCGGNNIRQVMGIETSYVRGYGFSDKSGTKRDMDIHTMETGCDPYHEHRQMGESREVVRKLQKSRERDKKPKTIHFSK